MKLVSSIDEIYESLHVAKRSAPSFVTNLFPEPTRLATWIARKELFLASHDRVVQLLRHDRGFLHLYFAAGEPGRLRDSLTDMAQQVEATLVADILGMPPVVASLCHHFEAAGFKRYKTLQRLSKTMTVQPPAAADAMVCDAVDSDVAPIAAALETNFDAYAEQIPTADELSLAVSSRRVLVIRNGSQLEGFLCFESTGQLAVLRYWYVEAGCRQRGLGAKLMRTFLRRCPTARRILLWVLSDNYDAIARYAHYGFRPDLLTDQVMIKEPAA